MRQVPICSSWYWLFGDIKLHTKGWRNKKNMNRDQTHVVKSNQLTLISSHLNQCLVINSADSNVKILKKSEWCHIGYCHNNIQLKNKFVPKNDTNCALDVYILYARKPASLFYLHNFSIGHDCFIFTVALVIVKIKKVSHDFLHTVFS